MAATGGSKLDMGGRPPRILIVDDEPGILELLRRRLEALGCQVAVLPGGSQVVAYAREHAPDLVLLDVMMPDLDGFAVCQQLKADPKTRDIPVVLMTARTETDSRVRGLELGAHDYVGKPFETAELIARVRAALRVKRLQDELKEANARLARLATSDPLTDLPNRRTFDEQIFAEMERARRSGQTVSVIMLDLDRFKQINDVYGHQVGDDVLRHVARVLAQRRRISDLVARYGGEEFVWVLPGARDRDAVELAEWVRRAVADLGVETPQGPLQVTISAGVTTYDPAEHGPLGATTVLEAADAALREAKASGRNRVIFRAIGPDAEDAGMMHDTVAQERPW
ncbi:MAG: diguanylate cyclase [Armatimonadota bacterium]|nr:diguanylate cyclase [Armatimonadota bacterium]